MINTKEWLISNRNGSYSSGTSILMNTRKYHGLFVKNMNEAFDRYVLLSKLFEEININGENYMLDTNLYPNNTVYPEGYKYLKSFQRFPFPFFEFSIDTISLKKSIIIDPELDLLKIKYELSSPVNELSLTPLLAFRLYHSIQENKIDFSIDETPVPAFGSNGIFLSIKSNGIFIKNPLWYYNFVYTLEKERGYQYMENLFSPGKIVFNNCSDIEISVYSGNIKDLSYKEVHDRYMAINADIYKGELSNIRNISSFFLTDNNIIAGYHWFGAWSRDTMISIPGLLLVNGNYSLAKTILDNYINHFGVPLKTNFNSTDDSEDVSLWFIYAMWKYMKYSGDKEFIKKNIKYISDLVEYYFKENDLHMLDDGFIILKKGHLTWMDGKYNDKVFTPRSGGAIEINALWYNALMSVISMGNETGIKVPEKYNDTALLLKYNFEKRYSKNGKLLDTIMPDDPSFRPNLIFAFSLPFNVMKNFKDYKKSFDDELLTPYGLRTLSKYDKNFHPLYNGDQESRDSAYHNGTVWPWLAGPYISACIKSGIKREELIKYFRPIYNLDYIPEIYDGIPDTPKGCILQAWSYGEIIRAYFEDIKS